MVEIPAATKERARALLMSKCTVSQIERETGLSQQQINGVWTGLKIKGWVARDARIGMIGQPQPASGPAGGRPSDHLFPGMERSPTQTAGPIAVGGRVGEPGLLMAPSQQTITASEQRPKIGEYVLVRTAERRKREDPYEKLWEEEYQDLIRRMKRSRVDAMIAENERVTKRIRSEMQKADIAQRRALEEWRTSQASNRRDDLIRMVAVMANTGMDMKDAIDLVWRASFLGLI